MKVIVRPRQAGKTYGLVQWVLAGEETDSYPGWSRVLLCQTFEQANRIRQLYPALDYRQVFSFHEWTWTRLGARPVEVVVDNADQILESILGQRIEMVSMTGKVFL